MATGKQISDENKKAQKGDEGTIQDPSLDNTAFSGDPSGITGITQDINQETSKSLDNVSPGDDIYREGANTTESAQPQGQHVQSDTGTNPNPGMSNAKSASSGDTASNPQNNNQPNPPKGTITNKSINPPPTPQIDATGNNTVDPNASPDEIGEQTVSGDMPDPGSDDDTLENEHQAGLRLNEDEEHPKPLDIGSDVDKAEEYHKNH